MLSLTQKLSLNTIKNPRFSPEDINGLVAWYKFQQEIVADEAADGSALSPNHSTAANSMETGDRILEWGDFVTTNKAQQETSADKPSWNVWETAPLTEKPNINFNGNHWLDMTSSITFAEDEDFSIMAHVVFENLSQKTIYGGTDLDFFRINSDAGFRCKIGGAGNNNFTEASDVIETKKDYFITLQRSNGSTGDLRCYVHSAGQYTDKTWGSTSLTDPDAFSINNIGAAADDSNNFEGVIKNLIFYRDTVLTSAERKSLYNYLTSLL